MGKSAGRDACGLLRAGSRHTRPARRANHVPESSLSRAPPPRTPAPSGSGQWVHRGEAVSGPGGRLRLRLRGGEGRWMCGWVPRMLVAKSSVVAMVVHSGSGIRRASRSSSPQGVSRITVRPFRSTRESVSISGASASARRPRRMDTRRIRRWTTGVSARTYAETRPITVWNRSGLSLGHAASALANASGWDRATR